MKRSFVSVVLPVYNQADHIGPVVEAYVRWLGQLSARWELLLVVNGSRDASEAVCRAAARRHEGVKVLVSGPGGWGLAVRMGLEAARGDLLCYTNTARTSPQDLCGVLLLGILNPDKVVKARREVRGDPLRKLGSWLYNLECRLFLGTRTRDVNGTPKVFPRAFAPLLALRENGDLIDAEFNAVCAAQGYPVLELPLFAQVRHGGRSTTRLSSAWRMYRGAWRLRARLSGRP
ncbi:MAG TPA: glycosyltransferase family 2 protein [bacterium]|jgi:glycosyltransferase involved in cell wall biosynthesis|nr:glycosyltransferase family 2 protein [bacterium]